MFSGKRGGDVSLGTDEDLLEPLLRAAILSAIDILWDATGCCVGLDTDAIAISVGNDVWELLLLLLSSSRWDEAVFRKLAVDRIVLLSVSVS